MKNLFIRSKIKTKWLKKLKKATKVVLHGFKFKILVEKQISETEKRISIAIKNNNSHLPNLKNKNDKTLYL